MKIYIPLLIALFLSLISNADNGIEKDEQVMSKTISSKAVQQNYHYFWKDGQNFEGVDFRVKVEKSKKIKATLNIKFQVFMNMKDMRVIKIPTAPSPAFEIIVTKPDGEKVTYPSSEIALNIPPVIQFDQISSSFSKNRLYEFVFPLPVKGGPEDPLFPPPPSVDQKIFTGPGNYKVMISYRYDKNLTWTSKSMSFQFE